MHFTVKVDVNLARDRVIELFDNPENMPKWMAGLQSFEALEGQPGQPGAKSKLVFQMGGRLIEMVETITLRNLPDEFSGSYQAPGVFNVVINRFQELAPDQTRWESQNEFKFTGAMRFMGGMMKGAFEKQSLQYMHDFKAFAENGLDVRSP